jgi:LacI family transcriptional regulator
VTETLPKRSPTMRDIARLAGVSQTTVSFVLNNKPNIAIADETRQKIWQVVEELGYRPNSLARSLRSNRTRLIGFVSDEIATTPFAGGIIQGAQETAWNAGYLLLLINTGRSPEARDEAVRVMLEHQVEGILYASWFHRRVDPPAMLREAPCVLLDCFAADASLPSVVPDEVQGAFTAVEHLLAKGHRRIGFINLDDRIPAVRGRLTGYKQALAAHSVPFDPSLVVAVDRNAHGGYQGALDLMHLPQPPTALFCFNDRMAMGAYDALRKLGLAVGADVAVVGFDNQEIIAAQLYPGLTTMELPHYGMGEWGVNCLLEHALRMPPPVQHKIACPLIERQSA